MKKVKYGWRQCFRNYRFNSIFFKNFVLIFVLIIVPFVCILGISYYSYSRIQKSEKKAYTEQLVTQISAEVESIFKEIRDKAIMLSADSDVELFYYAESIEQDQFYDVHNILKFLSLYNLSTDVIDSVYVYAPYSDVVISAGGRYNYSNFIDKECLDSWEEKEGYFQLAYHDRKVIGKDQRVISFYYTTHYIAGRTGVAVINISIDKLMNVLDCYSETLSLIIVGNGQVLYDSTMEKNGMYVTDLEGLVLKAENEIVVTNQLDVNDLEVVVRIDSRPINAVLEDLRNYISLFVVIMLAISILLALYISRKIFDPFSEILKALEEAPEIVEEGLLQDKNELNYIMNSIYATISKNKDIEEELLERIKLLKKAQAVALQSQINPHFINNTLETVNWMAIGKLGEINDISEMLNSLSRLLRISLKDSDTFVTLQEEIEYIKEYLHIQQKRLKDSFDVTIDVPAEIEKCKVIKIMLQPIVENAIEYGILPYGGRGELKIYAERVDDDTVCVIVEDSGIGMVPEKVEEINDSICKTVIKENRHIGLHNVSQRMKLAFGDDYGIIVKSKIGFGTKVIFRLPYQI